MIYALLNEIYGENLTNLIYKNIYDATLTELKRTHLMAEIRGERYVQVYNTATMVVVKCLNCYAYGRTDQFGYHDCSCHREDDAGEVRKISYLEFIRKNALVRSRCLYMHNRLHNIHNEYMPDDVMYKDECTNSYVFKYNLNHIEY